MLASVRSATVVGVGGAEVVVEVHVARGLPGFTIVGLPDASCREARDRVRAAVVSSGCEWPARRVTVNLAPGDLRKVGAGFDLPIAVGVLVASGQLPPSSVDRPFVGELGLDGDIRAVSGVLAMARALGDGEVVVPAGNASEAGLLERPTARPFETLRQLLGVLRTGGPWPAPPRSSAAPELRAPDFADVRGQAMARRAIEIAAAGGHHVLMVGPPGTGKTMLAERIPSLLGPLSADEAVDVSSIRSVAGHRVVGGLSHEVPFRSPHHSATTVALVGGGSHRIRPGEVSLAHHGVLFLDELAEFSATSLDALRQPLEEGVVRVARAHATCDLPAEFQLVAAMNPCPCGAATDRHCVCGPSNLARYRRRVSGPLLDRFDIRIVVAPPCAAQIVDDRVAESSASIRERVSRARGAAVDRGVRCNRQLPSCTLEEVAPLSVEASELAERAVAAGLLTGRGLRRVRAVALTIKDLAGTGGAVEVEELAEAMAVRADVCSPVSPGGQAWGHDG